MADREDFVAVHNRIRESWRPYAPKALDAKVERSKFLSSLLSFFLIIHGIIVQRVLQGKPSLPRAS